MLALNSRAPEVYTSHSFCVMRGRPCFPCDQARRPCTVASYGFSGSWFSTGPVSGRPLPERLVDRGGAGVFRTAHRARDPSRMRSPSNHAGNLRSAPADTPATEPEVHPLEALDRYAGWLGRDRLSVAIRADVVALGEAMGAGTGASTCLRALDDDIARLPAGGMRPLLRRAAVTMRETLTLGGADLP
jgi:hypothetical protein